MTEYGQILSIVRVQVATAKANKIASSPISVGASGVVITAAQNGHRYLVLKIQTGPVTQNRPEEKAMQMQVEEKRHVQAQIDRLRADSERHNAIAAELSAQADLLQANLKKREETGNW